MRIFNRKREVNPMNEKKLTKKEISKRKDSARKKRKTNAKARKTEPKKKKQNPITVEIKDGKFIFHGRSLSPTKDKNKALAPYGKQVSNQGTQLRILPSEEQLSLIRKTNGCSRFVRNDYLNNRISVFQEKRETLSVAAYKKVLLPKLKEDNPWLKEVDKFALEAAIEHVDNAYKHFFNGDADFPRFCSKYKPNGNRYTTKMTNNNIELVEDPQTGLVFIKLPKIGKVTVIVPKGKDIHTLLPLGARITSVTVILDGQKASVSIATERVVDIVTALKEFKRENFIAMDMGIRKFCDYGNGEGTCTHVENPRWITKHEKRLRRLQRSLSRKQYDQTTHTGSKNRAKAKALIAKEHRKIANQRKDFQHQLSRKIANACDVFVCETLNIRGMIKNRHISKQIASVGWGKFLTYVKYKVEAKGGIFFQVDRWFPSSKLCTCGHKNVDLKDQLFWKCPCCGKVNERDDTAVYNLAKEGIRLLEEQGILLVA